MQQPNKSSDLVSDKMTRFIVTVSLKTSLKIFKHYKLKPSFSIIKDKKVKDKVGVGDKPPPPSFNNLIKFDPI